MEFVFITNSKYKVEPDKNIKLGNIKYMNLDEYFEKKQNLENLDCIYIIDQNSIKESDLNEVISGKKPESIILLNDTLDWDKLIQTFESGLTYYVKPIKEDDFKNLI